MDRASSPGEGFDGGSIDARTLVFSDAPFDQSWSDLSPRLAVQWQPNRDTNLYASWSRAFRSGGANFRTASLGLGPRAYDAEQQSTFEIGLKQGLWDGRGQLYLAIFHNRIEDMQRETSQPDPISGVQQIALNAGDATLYGGEVEARYALSERLTVSMFAGYVHGRYASVSEDLNGDLVVNDLDRDLEIPRLAPWSYGVDVAYEQPLAGGMLAARLGYSHRDDAFYNDANTGRLAEVDMFDANLRFRPAGEHWSIALYGENLANEATWGGDTVLPSTPAFGYSGAARPTFSPLNKGRVIGLELRGRR